MITQEGASALLGKKVLVTCGCWFYAPDGRQYRAVHGTVHGAFTAEDTLGIRPNGRSTNWYLSIGNMTIAGCQIHYIVKANSYVSTPVLDTSTGNEDKAPVARECHIFNADEVVE